jgi:hypothetical protein
MLRRRWGRAGPATEVEPALRIAGDVRDDQYVARAPGGQGNCLNSSPKNLPGY